MTPVGQSSNFRDLIIPTSRYSINEYIITGVYFLYHGAVLQYIGQSVNILSRVGQHKADGKEFDSFTFIRCDGADLDALEIACIKMFRPVLNVANSAAPVGMKRISQFGPMRELVMSASEDSWSGLRTRPAFLTFTEVVESIGLPTATVKRMIADGQLNLKPVDGTGRYPKYKRDDVAEAILTMKYARSKIGAA